MLKQSELQDMSFPLTRLPIPRMRNRYQYQFLWIIFSETYLCKI